MQSATYAARRRRTFGEVDTGATILEQKVIIPDRLKTSELVVKLHINLVTNRGTDLYHMVF